MQNQYEDHLFQFRKKLMKITIIVTLFASIPFMIIGYITSADFWLFCFAYSFFMLIIIPLYNKQRNLQSFYILFIIFPSLFTLIQAFHQSYSGILSILCVFMILSVILVNIKFTTILYIFYTFIIILYVLIGKLAWVYEIDLDTNLVYSNHVTLILPLLLIFYLFALIIDKIFIQIIINQREEIELIKNTQQNLLGQESIHTMQVVSAGIAHDFNNILTIFQGNMELLNLHENCPEEMKENLNDMNDALSQAKSLTQQLLSQSKTDKTKRSNTIQVNDLITKITKFALHGRKSKAKYQLDNKLPLCIGSESQLGQIIQNLIINADDAMPNGGVIEISTRTIIIDKDNELELDPGKFILLSVKDQGNGISIDIQKQIFNLFFTTKSNGSGIGLSVSASIAKNHRGTIDFESISGEGSTFYLYLPIIG